MYEFLLTIQYASILIIFIEILYVMTRPSTRNQVLILLLCLSALVNEIGYLLEMKATSLEAAFWALKIIYLGKPFIILSMVLLIVEYFRRKLSRWVIALLVIIHAGIVVLVYTSEYHNLYYTTIDYTQEGLFPHLVLGHGIVYNAYTILIAGYTVFMFVLLYRHHQVARNEKEKWQLRLLYGAIIVTFLGMLIFLTGLTRGYDITALSYLVSTIFLSLLLEKYQLLDPVNIAKETVLDQISDGFIVVDNEDRFLYANTVAHALFPDAVRGMDMADELRGGVFRRKDRIYDLIMKYIDSENGDAIGKLYIFEDITDSFNYAVRLEEDVKKKTKQLSLMQRNVTLGLADVIENRDIDTGGHVRRTSDVIRIFVDKLSQCEHGMYLSSSFCEKVINAAPMHDLGKIAVPDDILNKKGKYTKEEYDVMKTHSEKGAQIIEKILRDIEDEEFQRIAINIAYYHHEKWDGSGYPKGLKENEIPVEARIMALADVFDALVSKRCYKEKMTCSQAFKIIEESLGSQFDRELGHHFMECRAELEEYYKQYENE